jgi:pyridoxine kinase
MGDQGRLYVSEDVVPMYRELVTHADLILPNQFEAETLSGLPITDLQSLKSAVETLHREFSVPHVVVTSLSFEPEANTIAVAGSSRTTAGAARLFILRVQKLDCFFSGTGDMFAALTVVRMREAVLGAGLDTTINWMSGDEVSAVELPLARAVEKVLEGMGAVLEETMRSREREMRAWEERNQGGEGEEKERRRYLAGTKASEVRVVRNVGCLREGLVRKRAEEVR